MATTPATNVITNIVTAIMKASTGLTSTTYNHIPAITTIINTCTSPAGKPRGSGVAEVTVRVTVDDRHHVSAVTSS